MPKKRSRMTNGEAKTACQETAKRILGQEHEASYSIEHQQNTYFVYFSEGSFAVQPAPCPKVTLKLLNKIWHQVRPPILNN